MIIKFGKKSKRNLNAGLDYRLVHFVCELARRDVLKDDFCVFETRRTLETQKEYVARGVSKTLNSRHIPDSQNVVNAVDIVFYKNGKLSWDEDLYIRNLPAMKQVIKDLGYQGIIECGADWTMANGKPFKDYPHFQIAWGK